MYFETPGKENTEKTLELAAARARELGIKEAVLATSKGDTGCRALEILKGLRIVVVTYHCGFKEPFKHVMSESVRSQLQNKGVTVVTASHALSGHRALGGRPAFGRLPVAPDCRHAQALRPGHESGRGGRGHGRDAGALSGQDIVAIGGSGRGADTALVLKPAHQNNFLRDAR